LVLLLLGSTTPAAAPPAAAAASGTAGLLITETLTNVQQNSIHFSETQQAPHSSS
jgi:hypothetical protein